MIDASISIVPSRVSTEPRPALKRGSSSSVRTALSTASSAEPPPTSTRQPASTAACTPARNSGAWDGSAPAPPWTMIVGTLVGTAFTVSQSRRIAKSSLDRAAERSNRRVPSMPAARETPRGGRGRSAQTLSRPALLGPPAAGLRRFARSPAARRAGAGGPRRQPHGPDVHRGPQRRLALRRAPPRGLRQPPDGRAPGRRPAPARRVRHRRGPVRAAVQQARARRDRPLRALSLDRAAAAHARPRRRRARAHRLAGLSERTSRPRRTARASGAQVRTRGDHSLRRRHHADRDLSPEPAEHLHRQADAPDAPRNFRNRPPNPRRARRLAEDGRQLNRRDLKGVGAVRRPSETTRGAAHPA